MFHLRNTLTFKSFENEIFSAKLSLSSIPARCNASSLFVRRFLPCNRFMVETIMRLMQLIQKLFSPQHKLFGFLTLLSVIRSKKRHQSDVREVTVACDRESTARHVTTVAASNPFSDSRCPRVQLGLAVACLYARAMSEVLNNNMQKISLISTEYCCYFKVYYSREEWWTIILGSVLSQHWYLVQNCQNSEPSGIPRF